MKAAGGVEERVKREVEGVVRGVVDGGVGVKEGREMVVAVIMRETGVSGWAPAVRRGVEAWKT